MYGQSKEEKMITHKELKVLEKQALNQGWRVLHSKGGHIKWVAPNGKIVFTSATPSDNRAIKNIQSNLKSAGLIIVKKGK
jgi:predicted RNA binding protein YcfA (HicA-like mRNA interferase family)